MFGVLKPHLSIFHQPFADEPSAKSKRRRIDSGSVGLSSLMGRPMVFAHLLLQESASLPPSFHRDSFHPGNKLPLGHWIRGAEDVPLKAIFMLIEAWEVLGMLTTQIAARILALFLGQVVGIFGNVGFIPER